MQIDTSSELLIVPYLRGVRLVRPTNYAEETSVYFRVAQAFDFPCNVYYLNLNSIIMKTNEMGVLNCELDSVESAVGNTMFDLFPSEKSLDIMSVDKKVVSSDKVVMDDETIIIKDGLIRNFLAIKSPLYSANDDRIIGIFGCSILLGKNSVTESLALIAKLGLLKLLYSGDGQKSVSSAFMEQFGTQADKVYLTKREREVLTHYIRGETAKEIACQLAISRRTVEHHLENIKSKTKMRLRSELIDRFREG